MHLSAVWSKETRAIILTKQTYALDFKLTYQTVQIFKMYFIILWAGNILQF